MRFSPISTVPYHHKVATPEDFIINDFGKVPDINKDGALTVNEAVRLSRIIDGNTRAFKGDNTVIGGFVISKVVLDGNDLCFEVSSGRAIMDSVLVESPIKIDCRWQDCKLNIPTNPRRGKIIIFIEYKYSDASHEHRPLPQNHVRTVPELRVNNQYAFNPFNVCGAFYDPNAKGLVGGQWDWDQEHIVLSSQITYDWIDTSTGNVIVEHDNSESGNIEIINPNDPSSGYLNYLDQEGGLQNADGSGAIDGGVLYQSESAAEPVGIRVLYNSFGFAGLQRVTLTKEPISNERIVFYNGMLYSETWDWERVDANRFDFISPQIANGQLIYVFESNIPSVAGQIKTYFSGTLLAGDQALVVPNFDTTNKWLVFRNGVLLMDSDVGIGDYEISTDTLLVRPTSTVDQYINILQVVEGTHVKILYNNTITTETKQINLFGISEDYCYLVFYNGALYQPSLDYTVKNNRITFKHLNLKVGRFLQIIQV